MTSRWHLICSESWNWTMESKVARVVRISHSFFKFSTMHSLIYRRFVEGTVHCRMKYYVHQDDIQYCVSLMQVAAACKDLRFAREWIFGGSFPRREIKVRRMSGSFVSSNLWVLFNSHAAFHLRKARRRNWPDDTLR